MTADPVKTHKVLVCRGPECGGKRGSADLHAEMLRQIRARGLEGRIRLEWQTCFGRCQIGPNVLIAEVRPDEDPLFDAIIPRPGGKRCLYNGVRPSDAGRLLDEHVVAGRIVEDLVVRR